MGSAAAKRKGTRNEHKCIKLLEEIGYKCMRAGGSLGAWDVIAIGPSDIKLIQVKTNRWPGTAEMELLSGFPVPYACTKEVWRWNDYERRPVIKMYDDNTDEWTVVNATRAENAALESISPRTGTYQITIDPRTCGGISKPQLCGAIR